MTTAGSVQQQQVFQISASFRSTKVEAKVTCRGDLSVRQLKDQLLVSSSSQIASDGHNEAARANDTSMLSPNDIKLLHAGKVLTDPDADIYDILMTTSSLKTNTKVSKRPRKVTFLATGMSAKEQDQANQDIQDGIDKSNKLRLVKDDLSTQGQVHLRRRKLLGQKMLKQAASKNAMREQQSAYVFGRIETIPNLPEPEKARQILTMLSKDRGVLACMAKHKLTVGCLAELKPDGKVGQDPVCVMGLNQNAGQKILLRLRTDDFKGFRKILSIRKVLYHELAHNVHSEHDDKFFQLMRQIENECTDPNISGNGRGQSLVGEEIYQPTDDDDEYAESTPFQGGSGRLGGDGDGATPLAETAPSSREAAARAAMSRMGVTRICACGRVHGRDNVSSFLPESCRQEEGTRNNKQRTRKDQNNNGTDMMEDGDEEEI